VLLSNKLLLLWYARVRIVLEVSLQICSDVSISRIPDKVELKYHLCCSQ